MIRHTTRPRSAAVVKDARTALLEAMTEAQLQKAIVDTAWRHGWLVHHDPPVRVVRKDGTFRHRTAIEGDAGFPDLVLARGGETIVVELKTTHGRFEPGQREWLQALGARVIRPSDLDALLVLLQVPIAVPRRTDTMGSGSGIRLTSAPDVGIVRGPIGGPDESYHP